MSRLLVICMLSIALASLVTSDTIANNAIVCQGSACRQEKAGSGTGTSETSKRMRRHTTAADINSTHDLSEMAPNSTSSVAGDSQSARWNSETSVEQNGGEREKRWASGWTRCARGSYFHPDLGKCIRKEYYYADGMYGESSIRDARPSRTKPEIRHRRRWRSNSGGITGNRHWLRDESKGIMESRGFQRPYRTAQYLARQTVGVPFHQTVAGGRERWGDDGSGPRLYREPRDSRHERGFWSKLFHIHSSSNNETTKHEATIGPYIPASLSKQSAVNIGEADKLRTMQSSQDHESAGTDTLSDADPLLSKLEKELSLNATESKDLSPRPVVMKVTYESKGIESPEWNNDHSKVSDNSVKKLSAIKDLLNEEDHKTAGDKHKTIISGTDIENAEIKDSLTVKELAEKTPEIQNLVPPVISLNETFASNSVDYSALNNDGTDYSQEKLPGEDMAASKDFMRKQIQKPVGEREQTLMGNTSTGDLWATNNLGAKVIEFQNSDPSHFAQNETSEVEIAKSPASAGDHSEVTEYSSRIVAGTVDGVSKDFLDKQRPLPVGSRYKMFMGDPDTRSSIFKSLLDRKDVAGQVGSTSDYRFMNEADKESEITVNNSKYEGLPALYSSAVKITPDMNPKPEQKRRRDVTSQNLRTKFSDEAQEVDQMPVFISNADFTGEASEVLPLREKIHRIYELARKPVYNSQWSSDGVSSNEAVAQSFNNDQQGFHWWHTAGSDDSGIQNQQSLRPDESNSATHDSAELFPFYTAMDSNNAREVEKKKSKGEDLHHENTIAGKLISGLIKRPGEPISASGLNGPTAEQAISRTHEGPMTPTYEDSYSEIIPVDYGPQDFDLGSSSIEESESENNKDTLEYPLPKNAGGNQWQQQIFHGYDMPFVQDLGETDSQTIQDDPRWSPGVGVSRLISRDQHFLSPQSALVFQQPDYNQNSIRNSPEVLIQGSVPFGRLFPLSPSISLDQAHHRPFEEGTNPSHFSPTGFQHPIFGAAYPQTGGKDTEEQHLFEDSSRGLTHLQSMRSVSHAANSLQFPAGRKLGHGLYKVDRVNNFKKRNLPYGRTRHHSTADIDIARKLRVQRALRKFDTTGLLQSNIPLILPQPLRMNRDPFSNNPTGDVFQQSLPEANVYNADASQYTGRQTQNYLPQEQLLNMLAESGNQYSQTSNTADRGNLEFVPHNYPEHHESLPNSQFIPNSAQFETAMFQNPETKFSNASQTWFQSQNTYGSFEGYQAHPSAGAKPQGEKVSAQTVEVNHESVNDGEFPEPEKVPPQNYIPIYNYTLAEQKNVQIPIPNSNDSTYPSYDVDFPSRGMEGTQISASLEPSIQYEYPKTMEAVNVQAPLYPFSEKADNQRVSEASAQSSFSMSNESLLEAVPEMPMNGNSEVHDVSVSTKSPENLPHMTFVGHLAEQPSDLPANGLPSIPSEKQSQRQQLESQHVHQTRVESNIQHPSFHTDNNFNPPIKKSGSEPGKLQHFGTMLANELKSLHSHQPTLPQKEESQLYSNTDSDTARAAYQKWLNERINMQARVLQALQPRSAPGQLGLTGTSQLSKDSVEAGSPAAINNVESKMLPVQGNANFPAVLKISVDIPSYAKMIKWDSSIQERSGVVHRSQDDVSPENRIIDSSNAAKILHKKEHERSGLNQLNNVGNIMANVQSPQIRVQNSQQDSAQDLSLIAPDRSHQEQHVAPIYNTRKSSFQAYIPQSVATATWANKMAVIRSICNAHKDYGHSSSNPLRLPRDKRQVVIHDDFLRDLLKMMNVGERYLFPSSVTTGVKQINTTVKESGDSNQLRQLSGIETKDTTSSKDGTEPFKAEKEIRISVDKIKDLCEIIRDNPSLLDSVLSKMYPEKAPQLKLESAIYQDPSIISSEQVENQSPNFPNEHILYTNSAGFHYSHEPHDGSHIEHVHETAGGPHTDNIHEEGGDSHMNHIHYPHEGPHTGQDSHKDQWHDEDRGSNEEHYHHYGDEAPHPDHFHNAGEASHSDHYHNADEASHQDHYHNAGETTHPDHWPNGDNGHHTDHWPAEDNGHNPDHWPNEDHGPHSDHWPNEDHGPHSDHWPNENLSPHLDHWHNPVIVNHPDHWPNVEQNPHPDHWHNGEESSHIDHSYNAGEEHYPDHFYDTSHQDHYYDTDENAQVLETHEELGSEDFLEAPEELPTDKAEGRPLNHVSSMVETSIDTIRCDDHVVHKLTIQIPADMWKLLQEDSGAHSGEPIVTIQIEVPVFDDNDINFEDFPEDPLVNTKRNTPEKSKEFQFRITPTFDKADVTKLENERKASDSHYSSEDDVSSLHQRTVSEFLHSLPGMQRTPSFNGPESNATVLQFVPGVYPEGIGQTKRQENSYFTNKERTRLTHGETHGSGNEAALHNNIARLSTESMIRLSKNDPRLLSFSIYNSQPGGLRILPKGGGTVPLTVVGPNGEVLYDTNKECQRVPARTFPIRQVPALITEAKNTVQDRSACNNSSCNQLTGTSMYSNGVPRSSPNVQLTSFNDLVRFFQSPDQPSVGKDRNLRIGTEARYKLDTKLGNTRNTRSSVSKKEKKTEMTAKILTKRIHSLSKHALHGLPRRSPDKFMVVDHKTYGADDEKISKRSSKTHRYTDEAGFGDEKVKDISSRFPHDPTVGILKHNDAPVLRKDNVESNHFRVLTSDGESTGAKFYEAQKYKRRLLWLEDNDDNEETVLPKVYARNSLQLVMGSLSKQTGIVDEQQDVNTNPLHYSRQFPGGYSDVRKPVDSYNGIQRSTKRSYNLHHDGFSYVTGLGGSRRRKSKAGETFEGSIDRLSSPHQQKRKSGLSHYFLKSQLARNHLLPNVRNGKYEPASLQPNTAKHRQRRFLKNWRRRQAPKVRHFTYWSNNNIHKFNYPNVQFFDDGHFEPKRGSELPNKNISIGGNQSVSTGNTTVNPLTQAQNSGVNNSSVVDNQLTMEIQQNGSAQSLNASVPEHSQISYAEIIVNTSGNHSSEQSQPTTTEICTTVEEHLRGDAKTNEGPYKSSGGDKVDASLDLKLKLQYDKNKDALQGEIQDFHLTPKGNESHADNVMQNHSNELQHTASIRSYSTLSYFRRGTVFPAQSVKERLALFEYSVKHGGRSHTFHGMPNSYKRNFDFKEVPKNDLPPSNYKSVHNFPFRQKDEALVDAMFHQVNSSDQYPYENSNSQNNVVHHYPHISYYSTNKNIDDVVHGQLSPADVLQSQSNDETLSHSVSEKWNVGNSKSASSQMKQIENYAEDRLPDSEIISANITNKFNYEGSDPMNRSPSYSSYIPEENDFESLVGKMSGDLHDSYSITRSLARYTVDEDEILHKGTLDNTKSDVESNAFNPENNPARVSRGQSQYPFTDTSNKNKENVATNFPVHLPVSRNRLNDGVSAKDVAGIGVGLESSDEDWKNNVDLDSIEVVRSFQHGRKILQANEDEADDDDGGDVDTANDHLLFEYDKLKDFQTKRKVNKNDSKFYIHPTSDDTLPNFKRSFHFRNQETAQRTPKRQHPKFKDRSMPKSRHNSSVKRTGTHEKKPVNSDPVYLTTYLETKQSAHPHDIQIKKHKEIKNDVLKSMHRRALSSAGGFSVNDNIYQPHKSRDYRYDKSSRKHTLPNSTVKVRRDHTYKKQQLRYNHKIVNPSHPYKKNSKSLLHQHEGAKIKVKKEREKKNKTRKKNLHSKTHTNIFHVKHSKHKHSPPKRHYLLHANQRQYRSKNNVTELDAGNILHKQRHHTRKKRSTNERETSNHDQPSLTKPYSGESEQAKVKNYESTSIPGNKQSLHEYESYRAREPHEMKSENIVKSVDLENNFLGINLKSPVTLSPASVSNETHYLKEINLETLGESRPVKYPQSSKLNYMYNLQDDVSPEKNITLGNLKLTEEMKYYPRTRHCSEKFLHLLPCSQHEDSERFYKHVLKPKKFDQPALSAEVLDKRGQSQQKGLALTQNNKKLLAAGLLPSVRTVSQELPQKGISELTVESPDAMHSLLPHQNSFTIGSHLQQDQPEPLSGDHIDVDSSINRNTHNAQHFSSMNISENIIPAIKFTGLADSGTKNRISELQNMYRHKHLQYANQPKHLSYINTQESKPVLLSDPTHSFGKGIVGTTENVTNLADKRMKYGFDARTKFFTNEKLPQKLFRSRSKEKFHISDKINVKNTLRGDTSKSLTFYVDKNPKTQSNKRMKAFKFTKSKSIQQNEDEKRVQEDNVLPVKKDSLFGKALTSKKGIASMKKLASNYSFNVYNRQLNNRSTGKKVLVNLQSAVNQARVNKIDLPRNIKIRADETEILTGNDDDIVVTTISDIVSDDEEEDEYEMIVTTEQIIPNTDAKKQWNFEPEDVTESTDYIEDEDTYIDVSTLDSLHPASFTETVPSATKVENWPEVENYMEDTDSVEEQSDDIEISTFVSVQSQSITEFVPRVIHVDNGSEMEVANEEIVTINQITTGAGTVPTLGHIKEGLTTEAEALTKSQQETEIPYENLRTANTEMYSSSVVSNSESQAAVNVEVETNGMQIENEGGHENENTTVLEMKGSPGKVTPTSTFLSTKKNTMKITSEITVTAKIMTDENEAIEIVPEKENTEITNKNTFTSISDKEYEESTENVSAEIMPTEIYNTEGNFKPESEKEGEEEGEVEVEETEETTGYEKPEIYSKSMPPAATVAVSGISTEYENNEKIETVTTGIGTESDTEITQVLEKYPQTSYVEGAEEEPVEEEATELRETTEESTEGITDTTAEEVGGGDEEEVGEEAGKEESTEEIVGTLAPVAEEEGEELGEGLGEEAVEVGEEGSTAGIIGTLAPIAAEEGEEETGGEEFEEEGEDRGEMGEEETTEGILEGEEETGGEEFEEEGEDRGEKGEEETTEGILEGEEETGGGEFEEEGEHRGEVGEEETTEGILEPIPEKEGEEETGGEDMDEKGGEEVGGEETTEEIAGTLLPAAEEEGEEVGEEEVEEEPVEGEEVGEEDTAEGITGTSSTSEDKGELGEEEEEEEEDKEIGGSGEEEGDVVPLGEGGEEEEMVGEEEGDDDEEEKEELEIEATSVKTAGKMLTGNESSTNRLESVKVEEGVTTEGNGRTAAKGVTEEEIVEEESTTEEAEEVQEEEIAEEEVTTEVKTTSGIVATTEEGEMIEDEETTALEEITEEQETTTVVKTTEEEGTTETEETLKEEEEYAEYSVPEGTTQGVDMTIDKTVQPGETSLAGTWETCSVNQSSCICSLDDMLHELSATWKGSSVLEAARRYDTTCPKSTEKIGKFRITNDMEPVVPHQKERETNTVRLMKNITAIGILPALAVSNIAIAGQETLIFPGSHVIIPCANTTEMFQVDDRGISYHWLSPSGKEVTGGHTELIEDGKYLRLSGVVPRDDGTYRCETPTSDNRTASPSYIHRIRVVQLPQVVQQVTVRYKITPHCGEDMTELLQLFLAPVVRKAVCGQLCSISIPKASCSIGEDGHPQMMVIFLSRLGHAHLLLPGYEQSDCNVPCSARVDAIFARNAAQNLPRVLTSKGFRTAPLTSHPCPATWLCHS